MASPNTKRKEGAVGDDLYSTPIEAMQALEDEILPALIAKNAVIYDPCDGLGDISDYFEGHGLKVYRSDIKTYRCLPGSDQSWLGERDFLKLTRQDIPKDVTLLAFNPPFLLTEEFIDKAHELGLPLLMFNRLVVLESNRRAEKFKEEWCLKFVSVFGYRVSCTKGIDREPTANAVAYAWYFFDPRFDGPTAVYWFTK